MKSPRSASRPDKPNSLLWKLLTIEQLATGSLVHLVYWFGLGLVTLGGFAAIGGAVGMALREPSIMSVLLAIPVAVAGLLVIFALGILWRSFCEFYVVVIQIGEDLHILRLKAEADSALTPAALADARAADPLPAASVRRRRTAADGDQ